jgi:hypothetical protein
MHLFKYIYKKPPYAKYRICNSAPTAVIQCIWSANHVSIKKSKLV